MIAPSNFLMYKIQPYRSILSKIVHEYCYQAICGGTARWPEDLPQVYNDKRPQIDKFCQSLSNVNIPKPVTLLTLAASPGAYIPMLATILRKNEEEHARIALNQLDEVLPRLFSLSPVPSLKWRFIDINPNVLSAFARKKLPTTYSGKLEMFQEVFNFDKINIDWFVFITKHKVFNVFTNIFIALKICKIHQETKSWHFLN